MIRDDLRLQYLLQYTGILAQVLMEPCPSSGVARALSDPPEKAPWMKVR